jgi:hypothetical protein
MQNSNTVETLEEDSNERHNLIPKKSDRFAPATYKVQLNPHQQDVWATILWAIFLGGFIAIASFSIKALLSYKQGPSDPSKFYISGANIAGILLVSIIVSFTLSFLYFMCMQRFAGSMITTSLWISIGLQFVGAAACFYAYFKLKQVGYLVGGILFVLLGLLWGKFGLTLNFYSLVLQILESSYSLCKSDA